MKRPSPKQIFTLVIVLVLPFVTWAQNGGTAVLSGGGSVYLNGAQVTMPSMAVTPGDVIQTKDDGAASISAPGSSVAVDSNSIVRYRPEGFALDRGSISVATGQAMSVFARDFKISPASNTWTQFYVTRTSGTIGIIARKGIVIVSCALNSVTVKEGQQLSREDAANCGLVAKSNAAPPAAKGPIINMRAAEMGALAAGGAVAAWVALHEDEPVSPYIP